LCTGVIGSGRQPDVSEFSVQIVEELRCLRQSLCRIKRAIQTAFGRRCRHELGDPKGVGAATRYGAELTRNKKPAGMSFADAAALII
jgi:hypothetical protein